MHRPHRNLDRKRRQEGEKQQRLRGAPQWQLVPGGQVEAATGLGVQENKRDQHQQGAEQRVQEKLERGIDLVGPAPDADDQVHRDQRCLEKHVEQQAVERAENTDHQATQDEERAHVLVDTLRNHFPAGDHHHQVDKRRQQHKPERDAVQPHVVVDAEALDPRRLLDELHRSRTELEVVVQRQRNHEGSERTYQGDPAHGLRLFVTAQRQQNDAEHNRHPYRQAQQSHFYYSPDTRTNARRNTSSVQKCP